MSGENAAETSISPEQVTAAFEQGFNDDEDRATATPPAPAPQPEPEAKDAPAPAPAPEYVQVTRQDWERVSTSAAEVDSIKATLGKMPDQIYGTFGRTLDRRLAEIQQATPQGAAVQIEADDFAELKAQYPELADLTLKGLNNALGKMKGTGGNATDPKAFDEKAREIRSGITGEVVDATLDSILEADWRDEVYANGKDASAGFKPKYSEWIAAQPQEIQALGYSDKLRDAARLMRMYRANRDKPAPAAAPTPAPPAPAQPSMRQRQMAAAVAPRSEASAPAPKGKTPFEQGWESED